MWAFMIIHALSIYVAEKMVKHISFNMIMKLLLERFNFFNGISDICHRYFSYRAHAGGVGFPCGKDIMSCGWKYMLSKP